MRHLACALLILAACTASAPSQTKQAPVRPTIHTLAVDFDKLSEVRASSERPVAGTDGTVSVPLPGPFPGRIAHAAQADAAAGIVEGMLASDAPLRFLRVNGAMRAESFDGSVVYEAHERVTEAAPWAAAPAGQGCCGWWENTLWRAAPGAVQAGLLRAVTPPTRTWSVLDWHKPGQIEPAWRLPLTEGHVAVVAAAVSPRADQIVVVLADAGGKAIVRALAAADGHTLWTTSLDRPAAGWRGPEGRLAYSFDGARVAVVVQDPARCESCSAIAVFEGQTGKHVRTVSIEATLSPEFSTLGINGNSVWIFEHVTPRDTDMSRRPERCQYEAHDLSTGARRSIEQTAPEWGLQACTTWALMPRFGKDGVVGLSLSEPGKLTVLTANEAP
jgi:hypothetical protein